MSLLDKLFFWRHPPDELEMPKDFEIPEPMAREQLSPDVQKAIRPEIPEAFSQPFGVQPFGPQPQQFTADGMQLILAKLDAIKAGIETINAKLDRFDRKELERKEERWR